MRVEQSSGGAGVTAKLLQAGSRVKVAGDMLKLDVQTIARREGLENPNQLKAFTGLPYETCRTLWEGKKGRVDLTTLETLCDKFGVMPGHWFVYEPGPGARVK